MKRNGASLLALTLAAATALLAAGCRPAPQEWTIPFLNSLTGPAASYGELFQWSAERAAQEINQAGGIKGKPVRIVAVDTGSDPQKGIVEMARVTKDSLVALGPVPEEVILAAMPIAVEAGMVSITATTSLEYAQKFFPWTVSWFPETSSALAVLVATWADQYPDMKRVLQFVEASGPWLGMADAHSVGLRSRNIQVLDPVEVPSDAVNLGPLAVKALAEKPDGMVFVCSPDKIARIVRELKNRGWTRMERLLVFSSGDTPELYNAGGADLNGVQIYGYFDPGADNPRWNAVKDAYEGSHGGTPAPSLLTNYYDAVYMIKAAIENTDVQGNPRRLKEERKMIADYLRDLKGFQGVVFTWDITRGVPTNKPTYIFQIQDGQKKLVKEVRP
jgi:branched-chain amino acid transport system substrate-binding protein